MLNKLKALWTRLTGRARKMPKTDLELGWDAWFAKYDCERVGRGIYIGLPELLGDNPCPYFITVVYTDATGEWENVWVRVSLDKGDSND